MRLSADATTGSCKVIAFVAIVPHLVELDCRRAHGDTRKLWADETVHMHMCEVMHACTDLKPALGATPHDADQVYGRE